MSVASRLPGNEDDADEELEAAAQHLTKDFYSELMPGAGEASRVQEGSEAESEQVVLPRYPPLASLLGPLPTAASLGLSESIQKCITEKDVGELRVSRCTPCCSLLTFNLSLLALSSNRGLGFSESAALAGLCLGGSVPADNALSVRGP